MTGRESNAFIPEASLPEMIDELKSVLVPDDEIARIRQYGDVMREAREQRTKERRQLLNTIHDMEEAVRELRETSTRASADWRSLAAHTAAMQEMENEKFDLAKKINEQEAALSMLETEIEELRRESDDVEDWDVEQSVGTDKNALALQLFRSMGFVPHHSASAPDEPFSVLLVRSSKRNAAASFDVDPASMQKSKLSRAQLSAQLWAAAE